MALAFEVLLYYCDCYNTPNWFLIKISDTVVYENIVIFIFFYIQFIKPNVLSSNWILRHVKPDKNTMNNESSC